MNAIFPAMVAGMLVGGIMIFLSHVAPYFKAGNFVRDLDQPVLFGKTVTRREAHFVGIFVFLILSAVFGGLFGLLVETGAVSGFKFLALMIWGAVLSLIYGAIILPLEGHGFFGLKEDAWFPIDLVLSNLLWAVLFWQIASLLVRISK